jgi:hypothetical protein
MEKTDLNDVAKRSASERLFKAMTLEKLGPSETAMKLNILPQYVTMSKQEKYWPKMPKSAWDRILLWCNSGETLHHFKIPVGEVILEEKSKAAKLELSVSREIKSNHSEVHINKAIPEFNPNADDKIPETEFIEEMDALKIRIIIDLEIYVNGQKIKL